MDLGYANEMEWRKDVWNKDGGGSSRLVQSLLLHKTARVNFTHAMEFFFDRKRRVTISVAWSLIHRLAPDRPVLYGVYFQWSW